MIVLHMDEAQLVSHSEQPALLHLHTIGLGVPTVCLFTGLSHTLERLTTLPRLSRLAKNAVVDMRTMTESECAESTAMMLDALKVIGSHAGKDRAVPMVARLSRGWSHHVNCAQKALCRELLRVNGVLGNMNADRMQTESDRHREYCYRQWLGGSVLTD